MSKRQKLKAIENTTTCPGKGKRNDGGLLNSSTSEVDKNEISELVDGAKGLTLRSLDDLEFADEAMRRMDTQMGFPNWKDTTKHQPYMVTAENCKELSKAGDVAEDKVAEMLNNEELCKMLGEPLYIIRGKRKTNKPLFDKTLRVGFY